MNVINKGKRNQKTNKQINKNTNKKKRHVYAEKEKKN